MITDSKEIQDKLPQIMKRFNVVLDELGIEGEVLRLMIGDSENPDHVAAQEKLDLMLASLKTKNEVKPNAWICCDRFRCYYCDIA